MKHKMLWLVVLLVGSVAKVNSQGRGRISTDPNSDEDNQVFAGHYRDTADWTKDSQHWGFKAGDWALMSLPSPEHTALPPHEVPGPALVVVTQDYLKKVFVRREVEGLEGVMLSYRFFMSQGTPPHGLPSLKVYQVRNNSESTVVADEQGRGEWSHRSITLDGAAPFTIVFEGTLNKAGNEIAIDDISIAGKGSSYEREDEGTGVSLLPSESPGNTGATNPPGTVQTANDTTDTNGTSTPGLPDDATQQPIEGTTGVIGATAADVNGTDVEVTGDAGLTEGSSQVNGTEAAPPGNENMSTIVPDVNVTDGDNMSGGPGVSIMNQTATADPSAGETEGVVGTGTVAGVAITTQPTTPNGAGGESGGPGEGDVSSMNQTATADTTAGGTVEGVAITTQPMNPNATAPDPSNSTQAPDLPLSSDDPGDVTGPATASTDADGGDVVASVTQGSVNATLVTNATPGAPSVPLHPGSAPQSTTPSVLINNTITMTPPPSPGGVGVAPIEGAEEKTGTWGMFKVFVVVGMLGLAVLGFLYWRKKRRQDDEIPVFSRSSLADYHNPTFTPDDDSRFGSQGPKTSYKSFD